MNIPVAYRTDFELFRHRIREDQKADLIDGVIHMASPENLHANDLGRLLLILMSSIAEAHNSGRVFYSRVAFRLDDDNAPEPDLAFVAAERAGILREGYVDGPPDLALEIVSPESVERDHTTKRDLYARFAVREYWIVDPLQQAVFLWRLGPRRRYRAVRPRGGRFHSEVLPGWFLDPAWLWQDPLPAAATLLRGMLEGDTGTT